MTNFDYNESCAVLGDLDQTTLDLYSMYAENEQRISDELNEEEKDLIHFIISDFIEKAKYIPADRLVEECELERKEAKLIKILVKLNGKSINAKKLKIQLQTKALNRLISTVRTKIRNCNWTIEYTPSRIFGSRYKLVKLSTELQKKAN